MFNISMTESALQSSKQNLQISDKIIFPKWTINIRVLG